MHHLHIKVKAFIVCLLFIIPAAFCLASANKLDVSITMAKAAAKLDSKQAEVKDANKKEMSKQLTPVIPPAPVAKPTPSAKPAPLTPDKKKYASPNGYQIMTDGRAVNFRSMGVIYMHGYRYTYYSSRVLYHHRTPEWYACDDRLYRTADGYIVVASGSHPMGSIVPTPFGEGKVLDRCNRSGTIDIYVNF